MCAVEPSHSSSGFCLAHSFTNIFQIFDSFWFCRTELTLEFGARHCIDQSHRWDRRVAGSATPKSPQMGLFETGETTGNRYGWGIWVILSPWVWSIFGIWGMVPLSFGVCQNICILFDRNMVPSLHSASEKHHTWPTALSTDLGVRPNVMDMVPGSSQIDLQKWSH
jgi:hypothetical protein